MPLVRYARGQVIGVGGAHHLPILSLVRRGRIRLQRIAPDGREVTVAVVTAGGVYGPLVRDTAAASHAVVERPAEVCVADEATMAIVLRDHPRLALAMLRSLSARLVEAEARIETLAFASAPQRVAQSLLARRDGYDRVVRATHEQLAKDAAVARETVSKVLGGLERRGAVATHRRRVDILDLHSVQRLAAGL